MGRENGRCPSPTSPSQPQKCNPTGEDGTESSSSAPTELLEPDGVIKGKGMSKEGQGEGQYHNPNTYYRLIGPAIEGKLMLDGEECWAVIDSGTMMSIMSSAHAKKLGLKILTLDRFLDKREWGEDRSHIVDMWRYN